MVKVIEQTQPVEPFIDMSSRQMANVLFVGIGVGLATWLLQLVLAKYVFGSFMCGSGQASCSSVDGYASIAAALIATAGGLVVLVRQLVYRPLLIVIAVLVALWGLQGITGGMLWTASLSLFVVLYAAAYGLFTWLARIRSFLLTIIVIVIAVAVIRLALS